MPPATLLKLAACAAAGAALLFAATHLHREDAVASLHRDVREAAVALIANSGDGNSDSDAPPPSILVTGFRAHGKSSLVNTACRALAGETGPLLLRAEASPPGGGADGKRLRRRVKAVVTSTEADSVMEEDAMVELVEAPPFPEAARLTRADVEAVISGGDPECVLFVLRCDAPAKERHAAVRRLPDISAAVKEKGLNLIVVLTNKKAMRTLKQAEDLLRDVSFKARTDCVYFIQNYTWTNYGPNLRHPPVIKNNFETHFTGLTIIRQCLEFVKLYRGHSESKAPRKIGATLSPRPQAIDANKLNRGHSHKAPLAEGTELKLP